MRTINTWKKFLTSFVFFLFLFPATYVYADYKCKKPVFVKTKNIIAKVMGVGEVCVKFKTMDGGYPAAVSLWKFENDKTVNQGIVGQKCFNVDGYAEIWAGKPPVAVWGCVDESGVELLPGRAFLRPNVPIPLR
jgi:hypothetical protein